MFGDKYMDIFFLFLDEKHTLQSLLEYDLRDNLLLQSLNICFQGKNEKLGYFYQDSEMLH